MGASSPPGLLQLALRLCQIRSHFQLDCRSKGNRGMHGILRVRRAVPCLHLILEYWRHLLQSKTHLIEEIILRVSVRCCI